MTKTKYSPEDFYFWLGEDAEIESVSKAEFEKKIAEYEEMILKWREVKVD